MKTLRVPRWSALPVAIAVSITSAFAFPQQVSYQGELVKDGISYDGDADFKFAIVDDDGTTLWSNDGTSTSGSEPASSVLIPVTDGLFTVLLGGSNMIDVTADLIHDNGDPALRIWVDTGDGFEQLSGVFLASSPYALQADAAERSIGNFDIEAGSLILRNSNDTLTGSLQSQGGVGQGAALNLNNGNGVRTVLADGDFNADTGTVRLYHKDTGLSTVKIDGQEGGSPTQGGSIQLFDASAALTVDLDADAGGKLRTGEVEVTSVLRFPDGTTQTTASTGGGGDNDWTVDIVGGTMLAQDVGNVFISPYWAVGTATGSMLMTNQSFATTVIFDNQEGGATEGAKLQMNNGTGQRTVLIDSDFNGNFGTMRLYSVETGDATIKLDSSQGTGQGGAIRIYDAAGRQAITLDANYGSASDARIITDILEIRGGADLSENFDISSTNVAVEPGHVVVIDEERVGKLRLADRAYDRRVAGVVSGAGGVRPGMLMGQTGSVADGAEPVALTGRVYCRVDASHGAITAGDLLTTSDTPGHAMKASDADRTPGAVIGKAMESLDEGRGLILILVTLQ